MLSLYKMKLSNPTVILLFSILCGCNKIEIIATEAPLPSDEERNKIVMLYEPTIPEYSEHEISPTDAAKKAKAVAKKYYGKNIDPNSAFLRAHSDKKWFFEFYNKNERDGLVRGIVGINKNTGEATLEFCD